MAYGNQVDLLEPVNLVEHLDKMELYLGQVCQIAGISKMQLDYWTNKAQIPTKGKKQRIYDADALETVMLIKQAKDKGLNLGAAIEAARRFREQKRESLVAPDALERVAQALGRGFRARPSSTKMPAPSSTPAKIVSRGTTSRCQCAPLVQPRVPRHGSLDGAQRADRVGEQAEGGREERALEAAGLVLDRARGAARTAPAGRGCEERDAVPLRDHALGGRPLVGEQRTEPAGLPRLRGERRRRLAEPDELGVGVRQARARDPAFVDERVQVAEALGPRRPCAAATPRPRAPTRRRRARRRNARGSAHGRPPPAARTRGRGSARRAPARDRRS